MFCGLINAGAKISRSVDSYQMRNMISDMQPSNHQYQPSVQKYVYPDASLRNSELYVQAFSLSTC